MFIWYNIVAEAEKNWTPFSYCSHSPICWNITFKHKVLLCDILGHGKSEAVTPSSCTWLGKWVGCEELYVVKKQFECSNLTKHLVEFAEFDTLA